MKEKTYIPCAFINSFDSPEKIGDWESFFVKQDGRYLVLSGARTYFYKHPEAPDEAFITVTRIEIIKKVKEKDKEYAALYMFLQSQTVLRKVVEEVEKEN